MTLASARERNHSRLRHTKFTVDFFRDGILPRLAGLDQRGADCRFRKLRPFDSRSVANQNMIAA
jgi:hypothetical protein